jgi:hypothetical protein
MTNFAASRKEPLADMVERVHSAILNAGLGEPDVTFVFSEGPFANVSSVDRVLKRFPELGPFAQTLAAQPLAPVPGAPGIKALTNRTAEGKVGQVVPFATLLEIARGVPRSFPFHGVSLHFSLPAFTSGGGYPTPVGTQLPGIIVTDNWWVNGRQRSFAALTIVEAESSAKKLPPLPDAVAKVLGACGKVTKTVQVPFAPGAAPTAGAPPRPFQRAAPTPRQQAIGAVLMDYRARMAEIIDRAKLPHDLPTNQEASEPLGVRAGPKKPDLVRAFTPMGYDCRGESGSFALRRRTAANLSVEVHLDVGTWSNSMMGFFKVQGMADGAAFKASLILVPTRRAVIGAQYFMGGPERWKEIVENLAALVAEFDRSFVPAIEAAAGPSPDWYRPESAAGAAT